MEKTPSTYGLSSAEVERRIEEGKVNASVDLKTKSVRELFIENLCTIFNLVNIVLAALVATTGSWKNLGFLFIVFLNTGIGFVQSLRSKRMVDKLTLITGSRATVVRDGAESEIELDAIVLDDIVRLGRGDQIPADAVVVSGEALVNESLLTGESDLIRKVAGDELMSGSFVDSGLVRARVVHVGADNYVSKINTEAKYVKKVNSEIMSSLNAIVRFASVIMVPLGLALFWSSLNGLYARTGSGKGLILWAIERYLAGDARISSAILSTTGALLGMIPQGLVLLTSSVLAIATVRLARRKVLAQQLYCIETLARVDVLCLDKTGTITSGRMEVEGVYTLQDEDEPERVEGELERALANIARATSADPNETCQAILDRYGDLMPEGDEVLAVIPFSSSKKWSGASFSNGSYVMGAAQFVLAPEAFEAVEGQMAELAASCRVLIVARVGGFTPDGDIAGPIRPLGFVAIRDEIRSSAKETIRYFTEQGVELNVISGDDPRTVSGIASVVGISGADRYVDATRLDTPAKIDAAAGRYHVFGRVTPQQKRELVQALKARGHTVAMTGDGVNDVLALKEADCSIAMAAGSDAARNVAEIVLVDNDFASMPAVVAEGRRSINNLQRSAALFLTKTLFSMVLAAICIAVPPYPFEPIQMTLINFFCIGAPGFVLGLEPNRQRVRGGFLSNVLKRALPASICVILAACLDIGACKLFDYSSTVLSTMCVITTSAVCCSLIFRISRPFTPLRAALFVFVCAGLCVGIIGFPRIFSISQLKFGVFIQLAVIAFVSIVVFFWLADFFEARDLGGTRMSTGFGRGVRVHVRRGSRSVTAGESFVAKRFRKFSEMRNRAAADAAEPGESAPRERTIAPARRRRSISQSSQGIRVSMPKRKCAAKSKSASKSE